MYNISSWNKGNIGRRYDRFEVRDRWLSLRAYFAGEDSGLPTSSLNKIDLAVKKHVDMRVGQALDSGRSFGSTYQDILVTFDFPVQDGALSVGGTATGHTIKVNGSAQTTTYRSGSGTSKWVLRIPVILKSTDTISYSYSQSTGATVRVDANSVEVDNVTDKPVNNFTTKRFRFYLKKADGSAVVSETIKIAALNYNGGTVDSQWNAQGSWMKPLWLATTSTDSSGFVDIQSYCNCNPGDTEYLAIIRPNTSPVESMLWTATLV